MQLFSSVIVNEFEDKSDRFEIKNSIMYQMYILKESLQQQQPRAK